MSITDGNSIRSGRDKNAVLDGDDNDTLSKL